MSAQQKPRSLEGKVAIVTGASRGIGEAIAGDLASRGAKVTLAYKSDQSKPKVDALVAKCESEFRTSAIGVQCNLSSIDAPKKIVDATLRAFGPKIDILVNNAAILSGFSSLDITPEHFDEVFHVNVRAPLLMLQAVLPHLQRSNGRIINISSAGARSGYEGIAAYCGSKAALEGFTRCWAFELGGPGTTVNCVAPGPIQSDMMDSAGQAFVDQMVARTAVQNRCGTPQEVAEVVAFLAEERSSWISGQCLGTSGGIREALY